MNPSCDFCGKDIDTTIWYPIVTEPNEENGIDLFSFCDEECQQSWEEGRTDTTPPSR